MYAICVLSALSFIILAVFITLSIKGDLKGFWNDTDGISITDTLAGIFSFSYFLVSGVILQKIILDQLNDKDIAFFQYYSWPIMTILGGYFGDKIAQSITNKPIKPPNIENYEDKV